MRQRTTRPAAMTALAALVIATTGCWGGADPHEPPPRYEQIPENLCDELRVEEMLARFDLTVAPWQERTSDYRTERTFWNERCGYVGWAEDGRFATEFGDFDPSGVASVRVYYEEAGAEDWYDQKALGEFQRLEERETGVTTAEIEGWWDSGLSLDGVQEVDPDDYVLNGDEISSVVASHVVRHENLVLEVYFDANAPTEDADEVLALLHDLVAALIDEAVGQLTLTG